MNKILKSVGSRPLRCFSKFNIKGKQREGRSVYLDNAATTPLDFRVLDVMMPFLAQQFGNPHSRSHMYGWEAEKGVENARAQIAALINAEPKEIIFTSGATESNNLAIKGLARFYGEKKKHFITTQLEHKCVLDSMRHLEMEGFEVTYLPVNKDGTVDLQSFANAIRDDTLGASIMMVNNEIGTIQDMEQIGRICRERKIFLHTDAAQAFGKMPIDVEKLNIDLLSISGHKIYGPKGVGALYVRRKKPRVKLTPIINGGGQERGLRSGTLPAPLVVGLGEASRIASEEMQFDHQHVTNLHKYFMEKVSEIPRIYVNGSDKGYPGIINISFEFIEGESLIMSLKNIALSSGSACTSASLEPSYVLRALGVNEELAHTSLRFGLGRFTTMEEINFTLDLLKDRVGILRDLSPLWEFEQEGISKDSIEWTGGSR